MSARVPRIAGADLDRAADLIRNAQALLVTAGAGMGVDSGLPDFRGTDGFWRAYPVFAKAGLRFDQVATAHTFRRDPSLAWGFYGHRLQLYRAARPHRGFLQLLEWGTRMAGGVSVVTSNVDGHFQRAGFDDQRVDEVHGSLLHLQCTEPCCDDVWSARDFEPKVDAATCRLLNDPPRCPHCGALARPNVLMFNDYGWVDARSAAQQARVRRWLAQVERAVVVECGAGTAIPSIRRFTERSGLLYVRVNLREPEVGPGGLGLAGAALATLDAIDARL